jgi:hypothetical protein
MKSVMIDLETMSTRTNAAIVSIGAVKFDPTHTVGVLGDQEDPEYEDFYAVVDLASSIDAGLHVDGRTVKWWMTQSGQAREAWAGDGCEALSLERALGAFYAWYGGISLPTYGNGAAFDIVVLRNAFLAVDHLPPWTFRHEMCYRTIRTLAPDLPYLPSAIEHHALSDAEAQAVHLQKLYQHLNLKG